jgi:hypothetical protein
VLTFARLPAQTAPLAASSEHAQTCWLVCLRTYSIVPVPKKAKVAELNNYHPVALNSVIMKCFEKLVKDHIISTLPVTLDLNPALCDWVLDFLTGHPQVVKVRNNISTSLILITGAP